MPNKRGNGSSDRAQHFGPNLASDQFAVDQNAVKIAKGIKIAAECDCTPNCLLYNPALQTSGCLSGNFL